MKSIFSTKATSQSHAGMNWATARYNTLLLDGELVKHLNEVDDTANQRMKSISLQMQERQGVNEALKARDQLK